jgi:thiol-disulfide isomerase/thioredoxin
MPKPRGNNMRSKHMIVGLTVIILGTVVFLCDAVTQTPTKPSLVKDMYPGLAAGALRSAKLSILPSGVLLRSGDLEIMQKDVDSDIAKAPAEVRSHLKNNAFFMLENRATGDLLAAEAKAWAAKKGREVGGDRDELLKTYFDDFIASLAVSDDEARAFYDANKDMMSGATFDQVQTELKDYLLNEKRQQAVDAHIATIAERTLVEVNKAWTARQYALAMNNIVDKARKSGKPTMVDFGADKCLPCDMMVPVLDSLKKEYAGKMSVLFVHVRKEPVLAARYGVQAIPVQVFFDKSGSEVFRHEGFFPKEQIVAKLAEMGVK